MPRVVSPLKLLAQVDMGSLRSDSRRRRTLPWEMLAHIYSYCDTPTLAVLSLVSFGSWEMAGPVLYEHVELTSLDGINALLLLEDAPPTARLDPAVPLLDRIKTITFHLTTKCLESESTTSTLQQTASGAYDFASISLRTPYRLRTAGHLSALPLEQLTITTPSGPSDAFDLACAHLLPRLDPRRVLHQTDRDPTTRPDVWSIQFRAVDVAYLSSWRSLRQVAWNGTLLHVTLDGGLSHTGPFYRTWSALGANPRTLELKFDFASQLGTYTKKWTAFGLAYRVAFLQDLLSYGGASRAFADRVPLRVTLLVRQEDAAEARKDVDKLEEWSKKLVVVETV